jgi:hypothetical protein
MKFSESQKSDELAKVPLKHKSFGDFTLHVRRPTYADVVRNVSITSVEEAHKFFVGFIADWSGVVADGATPGESHPVEFTKSNFQKACEQYPALYRMSLSAVRDVFDGTLTESEAGN